MGKLLDVPPELQHLIEKREGKDRRKADRRGGSGHRAVDAGLPGPDGVPSKDRRKKSQRRKKIDRRAGGRRRAKP